MFYYWRMFNGKRVSVVFATYREKDSVRAAIEDFFNTGLVDEVVVVNNNAEPGTDEEVRKTKAKLIYQPNQGYGWAFRKGIAEASGDLIVLCEPDSTYTGRDLGKFLEYSKDFDAVFGTRTNTSTIVPGGDMRTLRRVCNVLYGKIIQTLYGTTSLTEIGCTYKLFRKEALRKIEPFFVSTNPLFATELILLSSIHGLKFVEIPVHYGNRVGQSTIIANWRKLVKWAIKLLVFIVGYRIAALLGRHK